MSHLPFIVGTAAWNIPKESASYFPTIGSHLERYAHLLNGVEINSSFFREHKPATYAKWARSVPLEFRFSVKLWQYFTHERRLTESGLALSRSLDAIAHLEEKLGVILIQLPPNLEFDPRVAEPFFSTIRQKTSAPIAIEPLHESWNLSTAQKLLRALQIARVQSDPDPCPPLFIENGETLAYYRLHGSPIIYRSNYDSMHLQYWREKVVESLHIKGKVWCIFDNTTFGYATKNAISMFEDLKRTDWRLFPSLQSSAAS